MIRDGRLDLDGVTRGNVVTLLSGMADKIGPLLPPDQRHYAGMLQQLAVVIANPPTTGGCERCGGRMPPPTKYGRPRTYCTTCSPRKSRGKVQPGDDERKP